MTPTLRRVPESWNIRALLALRRVGVIASWYKEAKAAGVKLKKIWVTDTDPCDECQANGDAGAIPIDDEFPSGDDAETAHPGCKCHTESVVEEGEEEKEED